MPAAFDATAAGYDAEFTNTRLGRRLREAVWEHLADAFQAGDRVLELGCGTGEDAVWLARRGVVITATDASAAMLHVARQKTAAAGLLDRVQLAQMDFGDSTGHWPLTTVGCQFDGAFSNFGVLNCLADRRPVAARLADFVRPGGQVVLVVMGPLCPWEVGWYGLHLQPRQAVRRLRGGVEARLADETTIRIWYPSPRRLAAEFEPAFGVERLVGIGALLPPSYLGHLVERRPALFERLAAADRRLGKVWPWTCLNDHYLMVLTRRR